ncbi:MAG: DUF5657 family protein [Patescibacteria group bacterium]|jgi:uncharacterized membrane protein
MEEFLNTIFNIDLWQIAKIFVLIGLGVYTVFTFVVLSQVNLMTQVVSGILTNTLKVVAWLFFLFSIFIFIFTLLFF